jgi:hypothetical protein
MSIGGLPRWKALAGRTAQGRAMLPGIDTQCKKNGAKGAVAAAQARP